MKLTIVEKNFLSWTAMHIDFVMCKNTSRISVTLILLITLILNEVFLGSTV